MVTLLGFMCILFNVGLLVVMMPDLEGPVRRPPFLCAVPQLTSFLPGTTMGVLQFCIWALHVPDI